MSRPIGRSARLVKDDVRGPLAHGGVMAPSDLTERQKRPLVPWAVAKCAACGSTLVADPLPHRCGKLYARASESIDRWWLL